MMSRLGGLSCDPPRSLLRLRLGLHRSVPESDQGPPDGKGAGLQIDVLPLQSQLFPSAKPGGGGEEPAWVQGVAARGPEELQQLAGVPGPHLYRVPRWRVGQAIPRSAPATTSRRRGTAASLQGFGRRAWSHARSSARAARYPWRPPWRRISRLMVDGARRSRSAIVGNEPLARPREITSRSVIESARGAASHRRHVPAVGCDDAVDRAGLLAQCR